MSRSETHPCLELIVEHAVVHSFDLTPGQHALGRGEQAEIRLLDNAVSARHATVTVMESPDFPGSFETVVEDAGSKNGTRVNGDPVTARRLESGDMLTIGHTKLRYVEPGAGDTTETGVLLSE